MKTNVWKDQKHNRCIYMITFPNGKVYVGQTGNYTQRMKRHSKGHGGDTKEPVKEFGWSNCKHEILERCKASDANELEKQYIIRKHALVKENGYNKTVKGFSHVNGFSKEHVKKISLKNIGRSYSDKSKENMSLAQYNSYETIRPKPIGELNPMYGRNHTQESKDKISNTKKARKAEKLLEQQLQEQTIVNNTK